MAYDGNVAKRQCQMSFSSIMKGLVCKSSWCISMYYGLSVGENCKGGTLHFFWIDQLYVFVDRIGYISSCHLNLNDVTILCYLERR